MGTPGGWGAKPGALRGESQYLRWFKYPLSDLSDHWRERWAKPRAWRDDSYLEHRRDSMRLSSGLADVVPPA